MDGWMDGWIDGWMNAHMHTYTFTYVRICLSGLCVGVFDTYRHTEAMHTCLILQRFCGYIEP